MDWKGQKNKKNRGNTGVFPNYRMAFEEKSTILQ